MDEEDQTGAGERSGRTVDESAALDTCPNCGAEKDGRFCAICGQNDRDYRRSLFPVVAHVVAETFEADSRVVRTMPALFLRPGFLSLEFSRNRRAHYLSPFRLYLFTSLLFFLLLSLTVGDETGWSQAVKVGEGPISEPVPDAPGVEGRRGPYVVIGVGRPDEQAAVGSDAPSAPDAQTKPSSAEIEAQIEALKQRLDPVRQRKVDEVMGRPETSVPRRLLVANLENMAAKDEELDAFDRYLINQVVDTFHAPWPVVRDRFLGYLPVAMFFVLPLYALMLKVIYLARRRFYAEHLVFSMHIHTVVFVVFALMILTPESWHSWVDGVLSIGMMAYYIVALKRFYGTGVIVTLLAFGFLLVAYSLLLAVTFSGAVTAVILLF